MALKDMKSVQGQINKKMNIGKNNLSSPTDVVSSVSGKNNLKSSVVLGDSDTLKPIISLHLGNDTK